MGYKVIVTSGKNHRDIFPARTSGEESFCDAELRRQLGGGGTEECIDEFIELYRTKECSGGTSNLGLLAGQFVFSTILSLKFLMSSLPLNSSEVVSMAKTDKLDRRR